MNGEPLTAVSAPPAPTENTDTVLSPELAVASSPPLGLNATDDRAAAGRERRAGHLASARRPAPTENTDTVLSPPLAVASSPPPG